MTIREMVMEARQTLSDLQQVHDGEAAHSSVKRAKAAQTTAGQYISQGFRWLVKCGEATAAAVFVTLGGDEFKLTPAGQSFFRAMASELDDDAEDLFYGWSAVRDYLQFGPRLQPIVEQAITARAEGFLVRVVFIASRLQKKEE